AGRVPRPAAGVRVLDRARWRDRAGDHRGRGAPPGGGLAQAAAHRLERGALPAPLLAAGRRFAGGVGVLPRALLRARAGPRWGRARRRGLRRAVRERGRAGLLLRRAVPPREVLRGGPAPARQLRAHLHRRTGAQPRGRALAAVRLYPAVDILGGNAVRLVQGDYADSTVYDEDPLSAARAWSEQGARYLHVVDLDGARSGAPANLSHLRRITSALEVPVQYGGGLRSAQAVRDALEAGASRVILGTAALSDPDLLGEVLAAHGPERVLVSVDARGGRVATAGWTRAGDLGPREAIERLRAAGVARFVYTNVDRDGMLQGADLEEVRLIAAALSGGSVLCSGGIGELADLQALARMRAPGLAGVIVGKALYERRFTVAQAEAALSAVPLRWAGGLHARDTLPGR